MTQCQAPETKSAEETAAYADLARAFEAYKETNDTKVAEIEARLSPDVVNEEKRTRVDDFLDEAKRRFDRMALEARRPALGGSGAEACDPAVAEHKKAFRDYVRTGEAAGLKRLEEGALGRLRARRRLSRARHGRARGAAASRGDLADPLDRLRAHDLGRAL